MNVRNTIIAVVIFAVLLGVVLVFNPAQGGGAGGAEGTPTVIATVTSTKLEDVQEIRVQTADGKQVVVQRGDNGAWNLVQPETAEADRSRITALVSQLLLRPPERRISDDVGAISQYGLDKPRFEVAIKTANGDETYEFGQSNPNQTAIYMQRQGSPTVWLMSGLQSTLQDFVERPPKAPTSPTPTALSAAPPTGTPPPAATAPRANDASP